MYFYTSATNNLSLEPPTRLLRFPPEQQRTESSIWIASTSKARPKKQRVLSRTLLASGDKKLETEGKFDKAKGSAHKVAGDVKDAVKQND